MLLSKRKKKRVVVFVCTGNTCRSPMGQGLLQDILEKETIEHVEVKTAGVMTIPGLLPTPEAVQVMETVEVDIRKHRSAPLTPEMVRKSDLILGMTPFHVQFALRMSDDARGKTFLLKEYTKSDLKNYQITDPMGATLEVYKRVFREIKLAVEKLAEMDVIRAPLGEEIKHEKWVPPEKKPKKVKKPTESEEESGKKKPAPKKKSGGKKPPAKKSPPKKASAPKPDAKKADAKSKTPKEKTAKKAK